MKVMRGQKPLERKPTWEALIESAKMGCGFIMLGRGKFTLVDEDVMVMFEGSNWSHEARGYVKRNSGPAKKRVVQYLHRIIMSPPDGMEVDHRNRRKPDNRRENLRICTAAQNIANNPKRSHNFASQYKGVRRNASGAMWQARSTKDGKDILIGSRFKTEIEAARAYNEWAVKNYGEFACLNVL